MKKVYSIIFFVLTIGCILGVTGCGNKQAAQATVSSTQINYTEQTFAAIETLVNRDYNAFYDYFDDNLKKEISLSDVQHIWTEFNVTYGTFSYYKTDITMEAKDGYQIADVPCYFKRGSVTVRLTFNNRGEICGFFITDNKAASNSMQLTQDIEVSFGSQEYPISGSLTMPEGKGPFPVVILVHGSGPSDRNEQIGPNLPFMDLASQLAEQGIAVLRYDKRTYLYGAQMSELEHLTVQEETIDDVVAAVEFLKTRNTILNDQIYIAGHSLGGYLIPRIAQQTPDVAGYILLAAPARPMEDLVLEQTQYILSLEKELDKASKEKLLAQTEEAVTSIKELTPDSDIPSDQLLGVPASYWLDLRVYDPLTEIQQIEKPLLFLQGRRDYQVSIADFTLWQTALEDTQNAHVQFQLFDNLNHLFMPGTGKSTPSEYQQKEIFSTDASDAIAAFVNENNN